MAENQQKINELITKLKALGQKVKSTRDDFGSPLIDRVLQRVGKISQNLPGNGENRPQQPPQPQEPKVVCPRCGKTFLEDAPFCSGCGFDFQAEQRRQQREQFDREKLERGSKFGIAT